MAEREGLLSASLRFALQVVLRTINFDPVKIVEPKGPNPASLTLKTKKPPQGRLFCLVAEREGFEPSIRY